jgi:hypothetical protein
MSLRANIRISDTERAVKQIAKAGERFRTACVRGVATAAVFGHADMVRTLSTPGAGRVYGTHRASKPGDPPAPDTGQYRASWHPKLDGDGLGGDILTNDKRASWLEHGTARMAPRPHAGPVAERLKTEFPRIIERELKRAEQEVAE